MTQTTPSSGALAPDTEHHTPGVPDARATRRSATSLSLGATIILALATVMFGMVTSGSYTNYLQTWFKPYLMAAILAMGFLAIWTLLTARDRMDAAGAAENGAADDADPAPAPQHGHDHHGVPRVGALLLVPALVFAVAAPAALNTDAARRQSAIDRPRVAKTEDVDFTPLPASGTTDLTVQDYSDRYTWGDPTDLVAKRVRMTGFVSEPDADSAGQWTVNRFRIYCCAADANLYSVAIEGADMPAGENTWVEVEGVIDQRSSGALPVLTVLDMKVVAEPGEPYL